MVSALIRANTMNSSIKVGGWFPDIGTYNLYFEFILKRFAINTQDFGSPGLVAPYAGKNSLYMLCFHLRQ